MKAMTVGEVMSRVPSLQETATLREAVETAFVDKHRQIPILRGRTVVGLLTENDIRRALPTVLEGRSTEEYAAALDELTVDELMTRDPVTVTPETLLAVAVEQLLAGPYPCLPVTVDGKLVGMLTETDCLHALASLLTNATDTRPPHYLI